MLVRVERDASTRATSSCSSASAMDVSLWVNGWFHLDDEVNAWDVQATGCDISGNEHLELLFLEALEGHFTLVLGDVTVHHFDLVLDLVRQKELVGFVLCLSKHDSLACTIADQDVS